MRCLAVPAGNVGRGAIWELDLAAQTLLCIYASASELVGDAGDNLCVSPRGAILICEDGGGATDAFGFGSRLMGLSPEGDTFIFAKNNVNLTAAQLSAAGKRSSLAGDRRRAPCWMQRAGLEWLFRMIQEPGRLGPRYLSNNGRFAAILLSAWCARRLAGR